MRKGYDMLAERVALVRETLKRESEPWGRAPKLIAVTKYSTAEDILPLADLGVADIGENRVQALREKLPYLEGKFSIHLIGRLQSNKVKYIIKDVCMIHSLDSLTLAREIDRQALKAGRVMPVLAQVNIAREPQKGGVEEAELMPFLRACAGEVGVGDGDGLCQRGDGQRQHHGAYQEQGKGFLHGNSLL